MKHKTFIATIFNTKHKLAIPYSSPARISIGAVDFEIKRTPNGKHVAYPASLIPASWFIDLSEEI